MYFRLLQLELKNFIRNPQFGANLFFKIMSLFALANFAVIFVGAAFFIFFIAQNKLHVDPLVLVSKYLVYYLVFDLAVRYFMQQLPTQNIKPFLTQNISKKKLVNYTLLKVITNFFNWGNLLFLIPFAGLMLFNHYNVLGVLMWFLGVFAMFYINNFINILINGKDNWLYGTVVFFVVLWILDKYEIIELSKLSELVFYSFYNVIGVFVIPILIALFLVYYTYQYILKNFYLDKGLELKKAEGKTENIEFLNKYGVLGAFLNNDIRLIKRSKAAQSAVIGSVMFLFYGLLIYSTKTYETDFMKMFLGIFVTGGFLFIFGQRVPAWDSSYYPLMMTQKVPYRQYLEAKWWLVNLATILCMILAIGYAFISWDLYFTFLAAGVYNLGINSHLTLLSGAYNKNPVDLNTRAKSMGEKNQFNAKNLLLTIPKLLFPMAIFAVMKYFFGMFAAMFTIAVVGAIGFAFRAKIFDFIVKIYIKEKYSAIASFKKND